MIRFLKYLLLIFTVATLASCNTDFRHIGIHEKPRWEYAPNMYYSVAYEPLSQVTDSVNYPEYFNSNIYNPHGMTMREPVKGTIVRNPYGVLPIHTNPENIQESTQIANPLQATEQILAEGQILYLRFCSPCHGEAGLGDGLVGEVYGGVPMFNSDALKNVSSGHIFHVITYGKNRMTSYATQVNQLDRWKIAHFVHTLQNQE
jgi:mono/diheme cytochrome c family protein